jgi:hypothetical protein
MNVCLHLVMAYVFNLTACQGKARNMFGVFIKNVYGNETTYFIHAQAKMI